MLKLEISYNRVIIISWRILEFLLEDFFEDYIFALWNIWVSIILSFALRYIKCKWQGHSVTHPLLLLLVLLVLLLFTITILLLLLLLVLLLFAVVAAATIISWAPRCYGWNGKINKGLHLKTLLFSDIYI